jgi:pimeloyl-ACP methyl ester carboxylesterase
MRIPVNGVEIEVGVEGDADATPVVLLHGWPDTHHLWAPQVAALTGAGFRTIAPDIRGMGGSSRPPAVADYDMTHLLGDVLGVMDALDVERAHLVGHDWGAAISWVLAAVAPDRFDQHVALSVGCPGSFAHGGVAQREKSWYTLLFQFEGVAEQWLTADDWANFRTWAQHPGADEVIERMSEPGALTAAINLYRANASPARMVGEPRVLPKVQAPTMGVWSSGDLFLLEPQMQESWRGVDGPWRYERLDGVGHWMQLEAPDALDALLLDFLPQR